MKKDTCIVLGATANYASQLAAVLLGIKKFSPRFADAIIVFHDGICARARNRLEEIGLPLEFVEYDTVAAYAEMRDVFEQYSKLTFARFECFNLLKEYRKVVWHDVDILIRGDMEPLKRYGDATGIALSTAVPKFYNVHNFKRELPGYDMYRPLYNAGLLVLGEALPNPETIAEWCYNATREYQNSLLWGEQGILNIAVQEFGLTIEDIPRESFVCHPDSPEANKAIIVHAYGERKFWNDRERDILFPDWAEFVREWGRSAVSEEDAPEISVVMSAYERTDYLLEAVNSILAQTFIDFELIIVVEYGPKQTKIAKMLEDIDDRRIKILRNSEKLGFAESLNRGIEAALGKYIARFDDDDYSVPERLQTQYDFLERHPDVDIVGSYVKCFDRCTDFWSAIGLTDNEIKAGLLSGTQLYHPTVMMRKEIFAKYNLKYEKEFFTEDYALWAKASQFCTFANIPKILVRYRASGENSTVRNETRIQHSHIAVMQWQFKHFLGLEASYDEAALFSGRKDILALLPDRAAGEKKLAEFRQKFWRAVKKSDHYDEKIVNSLYKCTSFMPAFPPQEAKKPECRPATATETSAPSISSRLARKSLKAVALIARRSGFKDKLRNFLSSTTAEQLINNNQAISNTLASALDASVLRQNEHLKAELAALSSEVKALKEELENRLLQIAIDDRQARENELASVRDELHGHIDWVQRDIFIYLSKAFKSSPQPKFTVETAHPVAMTSPDHIHPVGTIVDHTRHPRFIAACERLMPQKKRLSFLDLGCSAGGIVWDAILRGHIAVGLEGSDLSKLRQRGEWRLLEGSLFTCDISKPFAVLDDKTNMPHIFDVVCAWEVLEHLSKEGLKTLFAQLDRHMDEHSVFFASISQVEGGYTDDGRHLHQTIQPKDWWADFLAKEGFFFVEPPSLAQEDFARGNGNPSIYYKPASSYRERENECLLVEIRKKTNV